VKLILAIGLPLLAVYLTVLTLDYRRSKQDALTEMEEYLTEVSAHEAVVLDQQFSPVAQVARSTAQFLQTFAHRESADLERLARANLLAEPQLFGFGVALETPVAEGATKRPARYVCRTADGQGLRSVDITSVAFDYTRSDWYLLPKLLRHPAWTDPYFDEGLGRILMCSYSVPLLRDSEFEGVVVADVSLEHIRRHACRTRYQGEYRFIVSRTGTFIYHPEESFVLAESIFSLAEWYRLPTLADAGRAMIAGKQGVVRLPDLLTGQPKWCAFANVPAAGWSLAAMIPEEQVLAPVRSRLHRQLYLLLVGLTVILTLVVLVSNWITRPLERLAAVVRAVAQGNLDVRAEGLRSHDEIGQFAATFNQMVIDLKSNIEATIRETKARQVIERELEVARQIQTSLLPLLRPPFPDRPEFSLDADLVPALVMAGDFYDFWLLDDQHLAVVIADVSGKGVPAAMFMAVARTTLRNSTTPGQGPRDVLNIANRLIAADNKETMFVTIFYGHYHIPTGELVFANAGHNPPCLVRRNGQVESLGPSTGPMLGVFPEAEYDEACTVLQPDDLLLLYTDGVTEAYNENDQYYGEARLNALLQRLHGQSVTTICRAILDEVNEYRRGEGQDDVTLVALRRSPEADGNAEDAEIAEHEQRR
jgi:sigma-B regulation protein RsbU (phosphoserine phosphatase)